MLTVRVVNMIPRSRSGETNQDSEPQLALNPTNLLQMVGTAFTPDPGGGPNAPIHVSLDGGNTWTLNSIVPGNGQFGTGDITVRFAESGTLYAGILRGDSSFTLNILRTRTFSVPTPMTMLVQRGSTDQPYVQAMTSGGTDRVFIGDNDLGGVRKAIVGLSLNAATAAPPAGFRGGGWPVESRPNAGEPYSPDCVTHRFHTGIDLGIPRARTSTPRPPAWRTSTGRTEATATTLSSCMARAGPRFTPT